MSRRASRTVHEPANAATHLHGQSGGRGAPREVLRHGLFGWRTLSGNGRREVKKIIKTTGNSIFTLNQSVLSSL